MKIGEIQFKFVFSLIFGAFLFIFIFSFLINSLFLYQKYTIFSLFDTIITFLEIASLKKNVAANIEISKLNNFEIEFQGNSMSISVFFTNKNFPLYDLIVFSPNIKSNLLYYDTKAVYLPFYVTSFTYIIPIDQKKSFFQKVDKRAYFIIGKEKPNNDYLYDFKSDFIYTNFQDDILLETGVKDDFLERKLRLNKFKDINEIRVLYYFDEGSLTTNLGFVKSSLNKAKNLLKDKKIWIVVAVKKDDYLYETLIFKEKNDVEHFINLLNNPVIPKEIEEGIYYLPVELVYGALLVENRDYFERSLKKFWKKVYSSYLSYSKANNMFSSLSCDTYGELDNVSSKLKDLLDNDYKLADYDFKNISIFINKNAKLIKERNNEKKENDEIKCVLY